MVVWFASGSSLLRWVWPVLSFGLPIVILTGLLSFMMTPWANQQSAELKERFAKREDIAKVTPGRFQESSSTNRVFFVEGVSGDATRVKNVFVNTWEKGQTSVVVANEGEIETNARGDKFLVLHQGRRYDGTPLQPDFRLMEFERYGILVSQTSQALMGDRSARALPTKDLLNAQDRFQMAELMWRLALPLMALLLILLAIPLSFSNPRAGRSANLLVALFLFVVYSNSVSIFQAAVKQNRMSVFAAWWPVHVVVIALIIALFLWRLNMNSRYHPLVVWGGIKRDFIARRAAA